MKIVLDLPLRRDVLRWVIERAIHEYIRLCKGLDEQEEKEKNESQIG